MSAIRNCIAGVGIGEWSSGDKGSDPDVVMTCPGEMPTLETLSDVADSIHRLVSMAGYINQSVPDKLAACREGTSMVTVATFRRYGK